ncbi:P-loop containing nucleoside triphosphate hydrolase protein [Hysterangium stoloniferum]|nr:P-loop containing nucleoside triphosphate hydrolase protein [Hysterangium stoloniferum]
MSPQLLGKRLRSNSRVSSSTRRAALEPPSPDITPNPKRLRRTGSEMDNDNDSNKENVPPEHQYSPSLLHSASSPDASTATPRSLRANRRATTTATTAISTPRRRHSPPRSRASSQSLETPTKTLARLSLATPPSTPEVPPVSKPLPPHVRARALLRAQASDTSPIIGRETERDVILSFIKPFLADSRSELDPTSLYISGAPGTGKTALVNDVLKTINDMRVIYVNCMTLGGKDGLMGVWERCVNEMGATKGRLGTTSKIAWSIEFEKLFMDQKSILVLDEIDHLDPSTAFSLASPSLCIIGISNTHTLTHAHSTSHTKTLHFEPYTAAQMKAVLTARLAELALPTSPSDSVHTDPPSKPIFPAPTIALLAMKIASQTGDIRSVFSVARRALDLAVSQSQSQHSDSKITISVSPAHIISALKATPTASATSTTTIKKSGLDLVTRVRNLGLHARFVLAAIHIASRRIREGLPLSSSSSNSKTKEKNNPLQGQQGIPTIEMTAMHAFYCTILTRSTAGAFVPVGRGEFGDLVMLLEGTGLVSVAGASACPGPGRKPKMVQGQGQKVGLAAGTVAAEVVRGLVGSEGVDSEDGAVGEGEVRAIWEREVAKIAKDVGAREREERGGRKGEFEGAEED